MKPLRSFSLLLTLLLMIISISEVAAQRSRSRRSSRARTQQETKPLANQWYAISIGNLNFGTTINLAGKFTYGFEFEDRFSIGPSAKIDYQYINFRSPTPDISLLTYGGAMTGRIKIVNSFYAIGEYGYTSFASVTNRFEEFREGHWYPAVGAGYKSGMGDWTYGIHILFPLKDRVRDFVAADYWIDFNYKF